MESYLALLREFVFFKTISTDPAYKNEIEKCVTWLSGLFKENGFEVEIWRGEGNPVVYADYRLPITDYRQKETILVYGHYDVQPAYASGFGEASPLRSGEGEAKPAEELWKKEGWKRDPFILRKVGDRLVARGVIDNKGQILIHMATVFKLIREGKLKYNIKFLIEGDEETGAGDLRKQIKINKEKLKVDHVLVSDGEIVGDSPVIELSFRGGFNCTLHYATALTNVHSGIYGCAIPNAAYELAKFAAGLYDKNNRVVVPGFYDGVDKISPEQKTNSKKLLKLSGDVLGMIGAKKMLTEPGLDFFTQTGLRPALEVTGFKSGYISEGYANIIPATAEVKMNVRLVTSQDPDRVASALEKYVKKVTPKHVDFKFTVFGKHFPIRVDVSNDKTQLVKRLLRGSHGKEAVHRHIGGAIPIVFDFVNELKANTIMVPLCNEDCNMHGAGENFRVDLVEKGLDFSGRFFGNASS